MRGYCRFLSLDVQNYFKYHCKKDVQRSDNQRSKILRYARTDSLKGAKFGVRNIGLTFFSLMNYDGGSKFYVDPCSLMVFSLSQCLHC